MRPTAPFSRLARVWDYLLSRDAAPGNPRPRRLGFEALESRDVPSTVTVEKISDAAEGGADGVFRFTRDGDLSQTLDVTFTVGGTAADGDDYTSLGGTTVTIAFEPDQATADVTVEALHDGVSDPGETVTVTVEDGADYDPGAQDTATLELIDTDTPPAALDGYALTSVNAPVTMAVLDMASDLDGDALTVAAATDGANGTVAVNPDGTVTYTPGTGFSGDDEFTYTVEDAFGNTATGTIRVTVTGPQAPPTSAWTAVDAAVTIDVLGMAFDPAGGTLTTATATPGSHGSTVIHPDGTVTYFPDTGFAGEDSFAYTVEDPDGNQVTRTVTVTVGDTDPIALDDARETPADTAVNVAVLGLAFQPAGGSLAVTAVTDGGHGTVVAEADGTVTYTPDAGFEGVDTFTYTVTDAASRTATGTITVTVGAQAPTAADELAAALSAAEDEVEDPDAPAATIAGTLSAVAAAVSDYLDGVVDLLTTSNIDTVVNQPFREFARQAFNLNRVLYPAYGDQLAIEAALWNLLKEAKTRIESVRAQRVAEMAMPQPDKTKIAELRQAEVDLYTAHLAVAKAHAFALDLVDKEYAAALKTWAANVAALGPLDPPWLATLVRPQAPPAVGPGTDRDAADITPR